MPEGVARTIRIPPNSTLVSRIFTIPWALTVLVVDPNDRFGGLISNLLIINRDAANPITVRINNGQDFTIGPNLAIPFNEQWIDLVSITPNAGSGLGSLQGQYVPNEYLR